MKVGDAIQVRNVGTDRKDDSSWANATVVHLPENFAQSGILWAEVEDPDHELHNLLLKEDGTKRTLVCDRDHWRELPAEKAAA